MDNSYDKPLTVNHSGFDESDRLSLEALFIQPCLDPMLSERKGYIAVPRVCTAMRTNVFLVLLGNSMVIRCMTDVGLSNRTDGHGVAANVGAQIWQLFSTVDHAPLSNSVLLGAISWCSEAAQGAPLRFSGVREWESRYSRRREP